MALKVRMMVRVCVFVCITKKPAIKLIYIFPDIYQNTQTIIMTKLYVFVIHTATL